MNTHEKNEIVKKMVKKIREKFFCSYYDNKLAHYKADLNVYFIDKLIGEHEIEKVTQAGLIFLSELKEDEISLLDNDLYGIPRNALRVLFEKALEAKLSGEMLVELNDMFQRGNPNCLFLFEILENTVTENSMKYFQELSKLSTAIDKEKGEKHVFSPKRDAKRDFIKSYGTKIQNLINKVQVQELSLVFS